VARGDMVTQKSDVTRPQNVQNDHHRWGQWKANEGINNTA